MASFPILVLVEARIDDWLSIQGYSALFPAHFERSTNRKITAYCTHFDGEHARIGASNTKNTQITAMRTLASRARGADPANLPAQARQSMTRSTICKDRRFLLRKHDLATSSAT